MVLPTFPSVTFIVFPLSEPGDEIQAGSGLTMNKDPNFASEDLGLAPVNDELEGGDDFDAFNNDTFGAEADWDEDNHEEVTVCYLDFNILKMEPKLRIVSKGVVLSFGSILRLLKLNFYILKTKPKFQFKGSDKQKVNFPPLLLQS